jgi:hypothetical protein
MSSVAGRPHTRGYLRRSGEASVEGASLLIIVMMDAHTVAARLQVEYALFLQGIL